MGKDVKKEQKVKALPAIPTSATTPPYGTKEKWWP